MDNGQEEDDDVWWYVCTLCWRAFTGNSGVRAHKLAFHPSSPAGVKNVVILSQTVDLGVTVKVQRCSTRRKRPVPNTNTNRGIRASRRARTNTNRNANADEEEVATEESKGEFSDPKHPRDIVIKEEVLSQCSDNDTTDNGFDWFAEQEDQDPEEKGQEQDDNNSDPDWLNGADNNLDLKTKNSKRYRPGKAKSTEEPQHVNTVWHSKKNRAGKSKLTQQGPKKRKAKQKQPKSNRNGKGGPTIEPASEGGRLVWKCPVCGQAQISLGVLKRHQRLMHGGDGDPREHICSTCGAPFKSNATLRAHIRTHDPDNNKPFVCDVCAKPFYSNFLLLRHRTIHEPPKLKCSVETCGKLFRHRAALLKHMNIHSEDRPYKCDKCELSFKILLHLRRHAFIHSEARPYACKHCPRTFKSQHFLLSHLSKIRLQKKKAKDTDNYTCHLCRLQLPGPKSFKNHQLKIHDIQTQPTQREPPRYECQQCNRKFTTLSRLRSHEMTHRKDRNEKSHRNETTHRNETGGTICETCGKAFKKPSNLRQHLASHIPKEDRPHICDVCGQRFALAYCMRRHQQRTHHRTMPLGQGQNGKKDDSKKEEPATTKTTAAAATVKQDHDIEQGNQNQDERLIST